MMDSRRRQSGTRLPTVLLRIQSIDLAIHPRDIELIIEHAGCDSIAVGRHAWNGGTVRPFRCPGIEEMDFV